MTPEELEKVRTTIRPLTTPDFRCADCWGPPTCPQLTDALWSEAWFAATPKAPSRCNCAEWVASRYTRVVHRVALGVETHWSRCDLVTSQRPQGRRQLLCLECVEARLGRAVAIADLQPCLGNYYAAVSVARAVPHVHRTPKNTYDQLVALSTRTPRDRLSEPTPLAVDVERWYKSTLPSTAIPRGAEIHVAGPFRVAAPPPLDHCDHGVTFDEEAVKRVHADTGSHLTAQQVRALWPRLDGPCPLGCGYVGIAYASHAHMVYGDW